jgi:hypothetical protein
VEKAQGVSESVLAGADTSESEESDEECVLDDLEMRFANLLNP